MHMKKDVAYPEEFERYWAEHKARLLREDAEYREAVDSYKMSSGSDWLLFGIPVVAGIVSMQYIPISHEILRWCASIGLTIILFALCVYVKSLTNPHRSIEEIESDVKKKNYEHFVLN